MPSTDKEKYEALLRRVQLRNEKERTKQKKVHDNAVEAEKMSKAGG